MLVFSLLGRRILGIAGNGGPPTSSYRSSLGRIYKSLTCSIRCTVRSIVPTFLQDTSSVLAYSVLGVHLVLYTADWD